MAKTSLEIRKITISAVFLSITVILKTYFSFYMPLFGENGMRVGLSGVFGIMPAVLFGPVYGAAVAALSDVLGYILRPTGAYLPLMTLVVAFGGFTRGVLWTMLKRLKKNGLRNAILAMAALASIFGIFSIIALNSDGVNSSFYTDDFYMENIDTSHMHFISRLLIARTVLTSDPGGNLSSYITMATIAPLGFAAFGFGLIAIDFLIDKRLETNGNGFYIMQLLITILASGMLVTTLNTIILRSFMFESWKLLPFVVIWLPRAIEEMVTGAINAYLVVLLYGVCMKQSLLKKFA